MTRSFSRPLSGCQSRSAHAENQYLGHDGGHSSSHQDPGRFLNGQQQPASCSADAQPSGTSQQNTAISDAELVMHLKVPVFSSQGLYRCSLSDALQWIYKKPRLRSPRPAVEGSRQKQGLDWQDGPSSSRAESHCNAANSVMPERPNEPGGSSRRDDAQSSGRMSLDEMSWALLKDRHQVAIYKDYCGLQEALFKSKMQLGQGPFLMKRSVFEGIASWTLIAS